MALIRILKPQAMKYCVFTTQVSVFSLSTSWPSPTTFPAIIDTPRYTSAVPSIKQVKLADIEDAVSVGPDSDIVGVQVGNLMWRSPEAHTQARVNKPSDIFSCGIVCIYAMTKQVVFAVGKEDLGEGEEPLAVILERQISYFADEEGLGGLLKHLGDSPWRQVLEVLRDGFNQANPRKPVSLWKGIDEDFRDLITGLTKFDPAQRLTAKEALNHRWFGDVQ